MKLRDLLSFRSLRDLKRFERNIEITATDIASGVEFYDRKGPIIIDIPYTKPQLNWDGSEDMWKLSNHIFNQPRQLIFHIFEHKFSPEVWHVFYATYNDLKGHKSKGIGGSPHWHHTCHLDGTYNSPAEACHSRENGGSFSRHIRFNGNT